MKIKLTVLNEFEELTADAEKNISGGRRSRKMELDTLLVMRLARLNGPCLVVQGIIISDRN